MAGLARICKMYGSLEAEDATGKRVRWVYDYAADKPVLAKEMPEDSERWRKSEEAKYRALTPPGF